jgi:hypothetical protein
MVLTSRFSFVVVEGLLNPSLEYYQWQHLMSTLFKPQFIASGHYAW